MGIQQDDDAMSANDCNIADYSEEVESDDLIGRAALYVLDGMHGRHEYSESHHQYAHLYKMVHSPWYQRAYASVVIINLALAIFEAPSTFSPPEPELRAGPVAVSKYVLCSVELLCIAVYSMDLAIRYKYMRTSIFWRSRWHKLRMFLIVSMTINTLICFFTEFRIVTRLARPLLFIETFRNIRKIFASIMASIPRIGNVLVLVGVHILLFGLAAFVLFSDVDGKTCTFATGTAYWDKEYCSAFSKNCLNYYQNPVDSMLNLFLLLTTVNCPDVFVPVYDCSPVAVIFFIIYLLVGLYFLLSLVMAVAYTQYQDGAAKKAVHRVEKRTAALDKAFALLLDAQLLDRGADTRHASIALANGDSPAWSASQPDTVTSITFSTWNRLMKVARPKLDSLSNAVIFSALTQSGKKTMTAAEFQRMSRFYSVLLKHQLRSQTRWGAEWRDPIKNRVTDTKLFRRTMDVLVVLNTGLILAQFFARSDIDKGGGAGLVVRVFELLFLGIFGVEIVLGLIAEGPREYFKDGFNAIDFVSVFLAICFLPIQRGMGSDSSNTFSQLTILARMLRLFRAMRLLRPFRIFFRTAVDIVPPIARYMSLIFCEYYFFAMIGMEAFAGRIVKSRDEIDPAFNRTSFAQAGYWSNNFDTFGRALVTEFELMVVNNFPITMEGYTAKVGNNARWFFVAFYAVTVIVFMNVLVAFVIDAYNSQFEENKSQIEHPNGLASWEVALHDVIGAKRHISLWLAWAAEQDGALDEWGIPEAELTEDTVAALQHTQAASVELTQRTSQREGASNESLPRRLVERKWFMTRKSGLSDLYEKLFQSFIEESGVQSRFMQTNESAPEPVSLDSAATAILRSAAVLEATGEMRRAVRRASTRPDDSPAPHSPGSLRQRRDSFGVTDISNPLTSSVSSKYAV